MITLVTGADGFVGEHLTRLLVERGDRVAGAIHHDAPRLRTLPPSIAEEVDWRPMELRDARSVRRTVEEVGPDRVVHLAGVASGGRARENPDLAFDVNVLGTRTLLDAVVSGAPDARVLSVGSGNAYGHGPADRPLEEDDPLRPRDPYASSKACQELVALEYAHAQRLHVVATRSFGHAGPGQRPPYVVPDWARQILESREGRARPVLRVGRVDLERDFCDVRDVVEAYVALLEAAPSGAAYNVCSGEAVPLRRIIELIARAAEAPVPRLEVDGGRVREEEPLRIVGDPRRLRALTGWKPSLSLETTITDLVDELAERGVAA